MMGTLRSVIVFLWMAVTVIPMASLIVLATPLIDPDKRWWYLARPWLRGAVAAARLIVRAGFEEEGEIYLPYIGEYNRLIMSCLTH